MKKKNIHKQLIEFQQRTGEEYLWWGP